MKVLSLFDLTPVTIDEIRKPEGWQKSGITYKDKKGRAYRRRPYWIDLGKGPEGKTCKTCHWLVKTQYSKTYYKCGKHKITGGPGTQIATTDQSCRLWHIKGFPMFTIKDDTA